MQHKKTTLKNGLRIITVPMAGTETVTVTVMIGVGSRYETEKEAGLSHFIEHMFFKGTKKRPTTLDISSELDSIGGEFNAFTAKDKTMYYAKVDAKHLDKALDVVADMYLNSKIDEKEINREKGTILQELNMYEDMPIRNVGDVFESLLYNGNPLGREIIGRKKTIKSFKRENFLNYMNRFYMANDTVVCVAGKINEKKAVAKIKGYFENMGRGEKPHIIKVKEKQKTPQIKIKNKKTDQTHFVFGVRAYHQEHKDRFALGLLSVILGGNMSSRLFIEVRERRGLAYYVRSAEETFKDCGYFSVQAGVEHKNLELAILTILKELKKITRDKISEKELQKAKDFVKGKSVMGLESSDEVAMFYVNQEVSKGKIMVPEEVFKRFDKVTVSDIMRVAKDIFKKEKMNLAVIGPHKNAAKLKKLLSM
ncbi:MAG TPA: pitrilysin family protein [Candidatus Moranbacteria bacterium]|nr:pitrilysin family protein [Candidatus Moranbacteria bacterium]